MWAIDKRVCMCVEGREKRKTKKKLQDGLYAFKLKSQSHIVLFVKRKSESLAEALP